MTVTYSTSVSAEVRAQMARFSLNQTGLAQMLGWDRRYLSRRLTGAVPFSTSDLEQIAKALDIPIHELTNPRAA